MSCPLELVLARAVEAYVFRLGGSEYRFGRATRSKGWNGSSSTNSSFRRNRVTGVPLASLTPRAPCPSAIQPLGCAVPRIPRHRVTDLSAQTHGPLDLEQRRFLSRLGIREVTGTDVPSPRFNETIPHESQRQACEFRARPVISSKLGKHRVTLTQVMS